MDADFSALERERNTMTKMRKDSSDEISHLKQVLYCLGFLVLATMFIKAAL